MVVLPAAAIAVTAPHAVLPILVSIVVTGLLGMVGKYLLFYARNRRARSIAQIRRAAIKGKIPVSDAEKLIRADGGAEADCVPQMAADDVISADDADKPSPSPSVRDRMTRWLHRFRLL
jgi:hypothetical protein